MKHTNFYEHFQKIRAHIYKELEAALIAHGGSYSWEDEDGYPDISNCPIVAANPDNAMPNPLDVDIIKLELDGGVIEVTAIEKEYGDEVELSLDDIFVEHLEFIFSYMNDAPEVSDVSIPFNS